MCVGVREVSLRQLMSGRDVGSVERLLRDAGLMMLGSVPAAGGIEPAEAWRRIIGVSVKPTLVVDDEQDDYLEVVDRKWRALAEKNGIIDDDGSFLISISGAGSFELPWAIVRTIGDSYLGRNLTSNPGEPEFITIARDGHVICGVTTEEDGIWLTVVPLDAADQA